MAMSVSSTKSVPKLSVFTAVASCENHNKAVKTTSKSQGLCSCQFRIITSFISYTSANSECVWMLNIYNHKYTQMSSVRRDSIRESYSCSSSNTLPRCLLLCHQVNGIEKRKKTKNVQLSRPLIAFKALVTFGVEIKMRGLSFLHCGMAIFYCSSKYEESLFYNILFDSSLAKHYVTQSTVSLLSFIHCSRQ